ncbi:hypothetical protein Hanom_Chr03g00233661 [Helianthus anomalus]
MMIRCCVMMMKWWLWPTSQRRPELTADAGSAAAHVGITPTNYSGGGQALVLGLPRGSAVVIMFRLFWLGSGF